MLLLNKFLVRIVELLPKSVIRIFANRYIAGDTLNDAAQVVQNLNKKNILATIDVLGEAISTKDEALSASQKCSEVLDSIHSDKLNANLSIKPTQFGLQLDKEFCYNQVSRIITQAQSMNNFVRLDMEDSSTTDDIIALYKNLRLSHDNLGIVIQAYLKRSEKDVLTLNKLNTNYRLCKGIYVESSSIAIKTRQGIRDNYMLLLKHMFENGNYVGIATHDEYLVNKAFELINKLGISNDKYEFQMLLGVREDLRDKINKLGMKIRIYVPFGKEWYKYSIRRLKENPQVAMDIAKNVFRIR